MFNLSNRRKAFRGGTEVSSVNSAVIDGANGKYFTVSDLINASTDWAVTGWVKFTTFAGINTLFSDFSGVSTNSLLMRMTGGLTVSVNNSTTNIEISETINTGQWYFWGATYNTTTGYKIAIDDTILNDATTVANNVVRSFTIGRLGPLNSAQSVEGHMNYLKVYTRSLTDTDFEDLYNMGTPQCFNLLSTSLKMSLVGDWDMTTNTSSNVGPSLSAIGGDTYADAGQNTECSS